MKRDKVFEDCMKELFRRVGERYPNKMMKTDRWYEMRAWTEQQEQDFRRWMVQYIRKKLRIYAQQAQKETSYFLMMYGWRTPRNDGVLTIIGKEKRL